MLFSHTGQLDTPSFMNKETPDKRHDKALGMGEPITRRDYLNSTLVASGSLLLAAAGPLRLLGKEDWDGNGGIGDYSASNGNTHDVMSQGHKIRDHVYEPVPNGVSDTGEVFDCVVVGGGISGLSAALFAHRQQGKPTCLVLEDHADFGGEARRNEFEVDGQRLVAHQGSAMWFPPLPGTFLDSFYESVGIRYSDFQYQKWSGDKPECRSGSPPISKGARTRRFSSASNSGRLPESG